MATGPVSYASCVSVVHRGGQQFPLDSSRFPDWPVGVVFATTRLRSEFRYQSVFCPVRRTDIFYEEFRFRRPVQLSFLAIEPGFLRNCSFPGPYELFSAASHFSVVPENFVLFVASLFDF